MELEALGLKLERSEGRLGLRDLKNEKQLPVIVDFVSGAFLHRLKHGLGKNQPLAKALGLKSLNPEHAPFVFDATAGLGADAFFIAALGCRVRAVERSPVVYALLADGYTRLVEFARGEEAGEKLRAIAARLSFELGSALDMLSAISDAPDIVYLDPMYPEEGRGKSALPKKGMQLFRRLIGDDSDAGEVLRRALEIARERVVVKRPVTAPALGARPAFTFAGKTARYDVYLARGAKPARG